MDLTGTGIWSSGLRYGDRIEALDAAAELESLGYTALWIPGGAGGDIFESCATVLDVTKHITVATGIVNLWMHTPDEVCSAHGQMQRNHAGRFLLGVGISHAPLIDANEPGRYRNPLATTAAYLDALDDGEPPVPVDQRVLAALGPKMLELARDRTRGAHPYLVTPEHTLRAREILGDGALLAPEQHVALTTDPVQARELARTSLAIYLGLPNYTNNWLRHGFDESDLLDGGSDRLVDAMVAWGDAGAIARPRAGAPRRRRRPRLHPGARPFRAARPAARGVARARPALTGG